jgi:hypothetical protein
VAVAGFADLLFRRQPSGHCDKPRVRDHAVLRPHAHVFDVPEAHQAFQRLDAGEAAVLSERPPRFHLNHRRQIAE